MKFVQHVSPVFFSPHMLFQYIQVCASQQSALPARFEKLVSLMLRFPAHILNIFSCLANLLSSVRSNCPAPI